MSLKQEVVLCIRKCVSDLVCCKRVCKYIELCKRVSIIVREHVATVTTLARHTGRWSILGATPCRVAWPYTPTHYVNTLHVFFQVWVIHQEDSNVCVCSNHKHCYGTLRYLFNQHFLCTCLLHWTVFPRSLISSYNYHKITIIVINHALNTINH